jgi:hypothetical protein
MKLDSAISIALFIGFAVPLSLLVRPIADALFLAPLIAFCLAIVSASIELLLGIGLFNVYLSISLTAMVGILVNGKTRNRILASLRQKITQFDLMFLAVLAIFGFGFLITIPPPLAWDARSIWLLNASWLAAGGSVFADAQVLEFLSFSHPNYPFGGSAAMAIVSLFPFTQESLWLGVRVIALLTLTNTLLAVKVLLIPLSQKVHPLSLLLLAIILGSTIFLSVDGLALTGYMDVLLASNLAIATAAIFSIASLDKESESTRHRRELLWVAALSVFASVGVKQEGIFFVLVLLVALTTMRVIRISSLGILFLSGTASYVFWKFGIAISGGTSESDASGILNNLPELVDLNSIAWSNFSIIWNGYFKNYLFFPNLVLVVALLVMLFDPIRPIRIKVLVFSVIVWIGNWAVIFTPYMLGESRENLGWWLDTSFNRIVATQLVFTTIFCGYVLANALSRPKNNDREELST